MQIIVAVQNSAEMTTIVDPVIRFEWSLFVAWSILRVCKLRLLLEGSAVIAFITLLSFLAFLNLIIS